MTWWLVGMMGAGKSVVGQTLARRSGRSFVDSDAEVERTAGRSIASIFEAEGEEGFRQRERAVIESVAGKDAVVALGGGAIAQPGMAALLARTGTVIYLRASPAVLAQRVGEAADRPLLAGLDAAGRRERLGELLAARRGSYESARVTVETEGRSPEQVADAVLAALAEPAP